MMQLLPQRLSLVINSAFFILIVPTALNLGGSIALAQTPTNPSSPEPLLNTQGVLESGDKTCSNESPCDEHLFQGLVGQRITITLESSEFDPWLQVVDGNDRKVTENDNISEENSNSSITVTLPASGDYRILAGTSNKEEIGNYTLVVLPGEHDFLSPLVELLQVGQEIRDTSEELLSRHEPLAPNILIGILYVVADVVSGTQGDSYQNIEWYEYEDVGLITVQSFGESFDRSLSLLNEFSNQHDDLNDSNSSVTTAQLQEFLSGLYGFFRFGTIISDGLSQSVQSQERSGFWGWFLGNPVPDASKELSPLLTLYFKVLKVFGNPQEWGFETNLSKYVEDFESSDGNLTAGLALEQIGDNFGALLVYQQELAASRSQERGDRVKEVESLLRIGSLYGNLGLHPSAIESLNQALEVLRAVNLPDQVDEIAQEYYQQRTDPSEQSYPNLGERIIQLAKIGARFRQLDLEAAVLINLGSTYNNMGQPAQALASYERALGIYQETRNPAGEAAALNGIGSVYDKSGRSQEALEKYHPALKLRRQIGNRVGESETLSHMGKILAAQGQTDLAIIFYKQSINITELIRQDIRILPQYQQEYYVRAITDTYRQLADLLLQQNRVLEAQQVLDLLKVQELNDYLRNVRGNEQTAQGLDFWQSEQRIWQLYEQSPSFDEFLANPEVMTLMEQLRRSAQGQSLNPQILIGLQDNLRELQNAALLYPLVLEDRLELILITPNGEPIRRTVAVQREDLNGAINEFRVLLRDPNNDISKAQQLYQWLIQPIAADLEQAGAETILFAADGKLRYVPLAALHDGNQWLIQRFNINYITAASLTDFSPEPESQLQVLAAAFSDPETEYKFKIGDQPFSFTGLEYAGTEVENIVAEIPGTDSLFDEQFSRAAVEPRMNDHDIVHFATHAALVPGSPEESFILFGNGDRVSLRDIANWSLPNVDLVVLSACKTAVGGELGNGEEILGFGYQIQEARARAAIASLWTVNDGGTQVLMNAFYAALRQDGITKAEALRQAQVALITGNFAALELDIPPEQAQLLSYPYYWAPFILIGNGL